MGEREKKMGTRADFYIQTSKPLPEYLGSIAWDGQEIDGVEKAKTEKEYRELLTAFLDDRDDATYPKDGYPFPWRTSKLTDETYLFADNKVWKMYKYDGNHDDPLTPAYFCWFEDKTCDDNYEEIEPKHSLKVYLPDMEVIKNVQLGGRKSGIILIQSNSNLIF